MSLFREQFRDYIRRQIFIRERILARGNSDIASKSRLDTVDFSNISDRVGNPFKLAPGAWYTYNQKQCVIRMSSLVDLVEDIGLDLGGSRFENYKGEVFARNFILEGGVLSDFERRFQEEGGEKRVLRRVEQVRGGFPKSSKKVNLSYGDPSIASDPSEDGYGAVPMPGIIDLNVRTTSAYGSLRQAKVNFTCHNLRQLEILELLYMRPGYPVTVEWGWSPYIGNDGVIENIFPSVSDNNWYWDDKVVNENKINNYIIRYKEKTSGNYDGFLGYVSNFNYTAREDGGFDCSVELISRGECLDSLKAPTWSFSNTVRSNSGNSKTSDEDIIYANSLGFIVKNLRDLTSQVDLPWYQDAGIWLTNYTVIGAPYIPDADDISSAKRNFAFDTLVNLLGHDVAKASIIPKDFVINTVSGVKIANKNAYIRLDALVDLINDLVIPKTLKGDAPILLSLDYIIPQKDGKYLFEPIRYSRNDRFEDQLTDISCNSNVCILPHQWNRAVDDGANLSIIQRVAMGLCAQYLAAGEVYDQVARSLKRGGDGKFQNLSDVMVFNNLAVSKYSLAAYTGESVTEIESLRLGQSIELTPEYSERRIGNIFLSTDFIDATYQATFKDVNATVGDFIKNLLSGINNECPNHNFGLKTDPENTNVIYIIDLPVTTADAEDLNIYYEDVFKFKVLSNDTMVREFKYSTQIPSALKATIAINAQAGASAEDIDSVTFAAFNKSIKSRLDSDVEKFTPEEEQAYFGTTPQVDAREKRKERIKDLTNQVIEYNRNFFNGIEPDGAEYTSPSSNIKNIIQELQGLEISSGISNFNFIQTQAIIPIDLNLRMDGISGIVMGNVFRVDETRLPRAYRNNSSFIVVGEEQQITAGQDWTTNIRGQLIMLPRAPKAIIQQSVLQNAGTEGVVTTPERREVEAGQPVELDPRFREDLYARFEKLNNDLLVALIQRSRYRAYRRNPYPKNNEGYPHEQLGGVHTKGRYGYLDYVELGLYRSEAEISNQANKAQAAINDIVVNKFEDLKSDILDSGLLIGDYQQVYVDRRDNREYEIARILETYFNTPKSIEPSNIFTRAAYPQGIIYDPLGNEIDYAPFNLKTSKFYIPEFEKGNSLNGGPIYTKNALKRTYSSLFKTDMNGTSNPIYSAPVTKQQCELIAVKEYNVFGASFTDVNGEFLETRRYFKDLVLDNDISDIMTGVFSGKDFGRGVEGGVSSGSTNAVDLDNPSI